MNILLSKFHWHSLEGIHVTGFIREGDKYLMNSELLVISRIISGIAGMEPVIT